MDEQAAATNHFLDNKLVDALFNESRNILILATEDLRIAKINHSASMFLGVPETSIMARPMKPLLDTDSQARLDAITRKLNIDGETARTHLCVRDYTGASRSLSTTIRRIACQHCQQSYFLFNMRKTEKETGDDLREIDFEIFIRRLLKGLSDSVFLINNEDRAICDCNLAAEVMFGYSRGELIGRSPQFLAPDGDVAKRYVERSRSGYASTGFYQARMQCRRKDGSLFMTCATNISLFNKSGELSYILAINRDITSEGKSVDRILRLTEQAKRLVRELEEYMLPLKATGEAESLSGLGFSSRQIAIAAVLVTGETTKSIAHRLKISESAVKSHLSILYRRFGVASRVEFVKYLHDRMIRIE